MRKNKLFIVIIFIMFMFSAKAALGKTYYIGDSIRFNESISSLFLIRYEVRVIHKGRTLYSTSTQNNRVSFSINLDSRFYDDYGSNTFTIQETGYYRILFWDWTERYSKNFRFDLGNRGYDGELSSPNETKYFQGDTISVSGTAKDKDKQDWLEGENVRFVISGYTDQSYNLTWSFGRDIFYMPWSGDFHISNFYRIPNTMPPGRYKIDMLVKDRPVRGWSLVDSSYFIVEDNVPYGEILEPSDGQIIRQGEKFKLSGIANDPMKPARANNIANVTIPTLTLFSGEIKKDQFKTNYTLPLDYLPGTHTMILKAYDWDKKTYVTVDKIDIIVPNKEPVGSINSPDDGLIVYEGEEISLEVTASDPDKPKNQNNRISFTVSGVGTDTMDIKKESHTWNYTIPSSMPDGNQSIILKVYDYATNKFIEVDRLRFRKVKPLSIEKVYDNIDNNYENRDKDITYDKTNLYARIVLEGDLLGNDILRYGVSNSDSVPVYDNTISNLDKKVYDVKIPYTLQDLEKYYIHVKLETKGMNYRAKSDGIQRGVLKSPDIRARKYKGDTTLIEQSTWTNTGDIEKGKIYYEWDPYEAIGAEKIEYECKINDEPSYIYITESEVYKKMLEGKRKFLLRVRYTLDGNYYYSDQSEFEIWVDDTAPKVNSYIIDDRSTSPKVYNFKNMYHSNATDTFLNIEIEENLSGIADIVYDGNIINSSYDKVGKNIYVSENIDTYLAGKVENANLIIGLSIQDVAGNTTNIVDNLGNIFVLDKSHPKLLDVYIRDEDSTVDRSNEPGLYYFNADNSKVYMHVNDNISGINSITYGKSASNYNVTKLGDGATDFEFSAGISDINFINDGEKKLYIKVWDRSGNIKSYESTPMLHYDNTKPQFAGLKAEDGSVLHNEAGESFKIGYVIVDSAGNYGKIEELKSGNSITEPFVINVPTGSALKIVFNGVDNSSGIYKFYNKDIFGNIDSNLMIDFENYTTDDVDDYIFEMYDKAGNIESVTYTNIQISASSQYEIETYMNIYGKEKYFRSIEQEEEKGKFYDYEIKIE